MRFKLNSVSSYISRLLQALTLLLFHDVSCQRLYNITYLGAPEPIPTSVEVAKTLQPNQNWFLKAFEYSVETEDLGNLLAGRREFPWVVDIRAEDMDQEFWAIGNVVSYHHVLTTCRFVFFHLRHIATKQWAFEYLNEGLVLDPWNVWAKSKKVDKKLDIFPAQIRVHYAANYLWEHENRRKPSFGSFDDIFAREYNESGVRLARHLMMHPECHIGNYSKDVGIIELTNAIPQMSTTKTYMPVHLTIENRIRTIAQDKLDEKVDDKMMCYVGSFGRNYNNMKNHVAVDYKVKYRVYRVDMDACMNQHWARYSCGPTDGLCSIGKPKDNKYVREQIWCFNSRAMVGAICDHDNGAPLVCDGYAVGIVIRAASFQYCYDMIPIPFLVLSVFSFSNYFTAYAESLDTYSRVAHDYMLHHHVPKSGQPCSAKATNFAVWIAFILMTRVLRTV